MGFLYSSLPLWVALGGWFVVLVALAAAGWRRPFVKLNTDGLQHLWLSTIVTLSVLWTFDLWVQDGTVLHLIGATLMVTLFGWSLALIGGCAVVLLVALILGAPWQGIGATMVALAIVPVLISAGMQAALATWFPNRRAPFVLGHGVATSVLAVAGASATLLAGHLLLRDVSWPFVQTSFLAASLILALGESAFTGCMTAIIAVYKPAWMKTFDKRLNRIDR